MKNTFTHLTNTWIDSTVIEHFEAIVKKHPKKIAINDGHTILTYHEVLIRVNRIADQIQSSSNDNDPIIILLENNTFFLCSMLACLYTGRGYISLDAGYAHQRNQQIITHSQATTIISEQSILTNFTLANINNVIFIDFQATKNDDLPLIRYNKDPESLAYVIYTSGSTGIPKGVYQNQRNLLHDVMQYINSTELMSDDCLTLLYSPSVSGSIRDIYGSLLTGATLFVNNLQKNGLTKLPEFIEQNAITIYHSIPSIFRTGLSCRTSESFSAVRIIYLAGDKIFKQDIELYKQAFSDTCKVYIGIGSTENATIYRQWFVNKYTEINTQIVPVGYSVEDRTMTLVGVDGNVVEDGTIGEIHVRSNYCSLGYWNDQPLSAQHFIMHEDGSRTVKTGDWGVINQDGLLEFKGRRDGQVKINGFRVEIAEIEAYIKSIAGVVDAAVTIRDYQNKSNIIAYLVISGHISLDEIRIKLAEILPSHKFPSMFYLVEFMPYLDNFKIDYQALKAIDNQNINNEYDAGINLKSSGNNINLFIKERLLNIWCEYASYESFKKDLSWKIGGGSSLEAVNFVVKLEQEFNVVFPNTWINENMKPSIIEEQLKQLIEGDSYNKNAQLNEETESLVHVYAFAPLQGITNNTREFFRILSKEVPMTVIDYPKLEEWEKEDICLENIANSIDKDVFKKGKLKVFIGHCSGDSVAFYVLNMLEKAYPNTLYFFIVDSWMPNIFFLNRVKLFIKKIKHFGLLKTSVLFFQNRKNNFMARRSFLKIERNTIGTLADNQIYVYAQQKISLENSHHFKSMNIKSHILISKDQSFSEDLGWRSFLPKLTLESLECIHKDIYINDKNRQIILKKVLNFIEEVKEDYRRDINK